MNWGWFTLLVLFLPFVWAVFIGAPFVPAHKQAIGDAAKLVKLSKEGRVVELGCGDGRFMQAISEKKLKCTGYELNPFVAFIAKFRLRKFSGAEVKSANFWNIDLPEDTEVVYTFLLEKFMGRLDEKMKSEAKRLNKDLTLISYVFKIPNKKPITEVGGVRVYCYSQR